MNHPTVTRRWMLAAAVPILAALPRLVQAVPPQPEHLAVEPAVERRQHSVPATRVRDVGGFAGRRIRANRRRLKNFDIDRYVEMVEEKSYRRWWWIGEQPGKWLESAVLSGEQAGDRALVEKAKSVLKRLEAAQEEGGYLGITDPAVRTPEKPLRGMEPYELYFMMHGLLTAWERWNAEDALRTAGRLAGYFERYIGPGRAGFWPSELRPPENRGRTLGGHSAIAGHSVHYGWEGTLLIDPVLRLYQVTGNGEHLDWCRWVVSNIDVWSGHDAFSKLDRVADGSMGIHEIQPYVHAHTFHMNFQGLLRLYQVTGDRSLFEKVAGAWDDVAERQTYVTGGVSVGEHYEAGHHLPITGSVVETCATMSWIELSQYLLELTGDPKYADAVEKLLWNHLWAAQTADGASNRYHTPLNGVKPAGYFHGPDCCTASGHRIVSKVPSLIYAAGEDGICVNQYVQSRVRVKLPSGGRVELRMETEYPEGEKTVLRVKPDRPRRFSLKLRMPGWCEEPSVQVNGRGVGPVEPGTYAAVSRRWQDGDTVEVTLPMEPHWIEGSHTTEGRIALVRGPVVYALDTVWWTGEQRAALGRVPQDLGSLTGIVREDGLERMEAPSDALGPAYRASVRLPGGRTVHVPLVPFANAGRWWEPGEERPPRNSRTYAYAVWLYGADSEQFRRRAERYRRQQKLMEEINWDLVSGDWEVLEHGDGLAQRAVRSDCRAFARGFSADDYTLRVQARKSGGAEGFLIIFRAKDGRNFYWWNVAGWGNSRHAIEREIDGRRTVIARTEGSIERGRWYDLKVAVEGPRIRCYLDGEPVHDLTDDTFTEGGVGLGAWRTAVEYRNLRVTGPDGDVLYRRFDTD